jgi:hypothetical protein
LKVHDHRKIHKNVYKGKLNEMEILDVPGLQYMIAEGTGPRNVYEMHQGDALWSITRVVNRLKDMTKNELDYKFTLMPLEIIWSKTEIENQDWSWIAMMQVPEIINQNMFQTALTELKKRNKSVRIPLRLEKLQQGTYIQTTHLGPYHQIDVTVEMIKGYCKEHGYTINNQFREIYINQPFCNAPEKLQTIIRAEILK